MLDTIFIGMSGLMGYSKGLQVIANNTANINTPGFKGATLQFGDLFYANGQGGGAMSVNGTDQMGQGLATYSTTLDFSQGELRQSGNDLDLAVDGQGLFMLKDDDGNLKYTRDGEFEFNDKGILVNKTSGAKVMAFDEHGALVEVSLAGLRTNPAKATSTVSFRGNLSNNTAQASNVHTLTDVVVQDAVGGEHKLTVKFTQVAATQSNEVRWSVTVTDGSTPVTDQNLSFIGAAVDPASAKLSFSYRPTGLADVPITFDFSQDVTSFPGGTQSTLQMVAQDGYAHGDLTQVTVAADGKLNLKYSNGQDASGVQLALARFNSLSNVRATGGNFFEPIDKSTWETGVAQSGAFGAVKSGVVEISNVDLSSEFSNLVIMQRGYQASSQVVSTANEMIQELFSLKGR